MKKIKCENCGREYSIPKGKHDFINCVCGAKVFIKKKETKKKKKEK